MHNKLLETVPNQFKEQIKRKLRVENMEELFTIQKGLDGGKILKDEKSLESVKDKHNYKLYLK